MSYLPVLMYHHVSPHPGLVTVSPEIFRQHMEYLARNGWTTLGAQGIEDCLAGKPLPRRSVVVSFDDGYLDNFVHAHPILAEYGLRAMLFVVTGWLGDGPVRSGALECPDHRECKRRIAAGAADNVMLRWLEVEAMRKAGTFEFHSHTHTHTRWDQFLQAGPARSAALAEDLGKSLQSLTAHMGAASSHLCWPQGYFDADYLATAQAAGFRYCYTTRKGVAQPGGDPLRIGRIVAKDAPAAWLGRRLRRFTTPLLGSLYSRWRNT